MPSKFEISRQGLKHFKQQLAQKLLNACAVEGVDEVREYTPVWSKRLYNSTRAGTPETGDRVIKCDIIAGGTAQPGEIREIGIVKDVDYALDQELQKGYIRGSLDLIGRAIAEGLHK